jgi:6-phosphogluconolactonase
LGAVRYGRSWKRLEKVRQFLMETTMVQEVRRTKNLDQLISEAASFVAGTALRCVQKRGIFTLALSGGSSPRPLYEYLSTPPFRDALPWGKVHVFWSDERCVPPTHRESNFGMAFELLLSKVPLAHDNIHRIPAEIEPPQKAAQTYEMELRRFFGLPLPKKGSILPSSGEASAPSLDLILLGVGKEGHTASLFPGSPLLKEKRLWVAAAQAPEHIYPAWRITLTLPLINQAACVLFLVRGEGKKEVVESIMRSQRPDSSPYPAAMVRAKDRCVWFIQE